MSGTSAPVASGDSAADPLPAADGSVRGPSAGADDGMPDTASLPLGAHVHPDGTTSIVVWAPDAEHVRVRLHADPVRTIDMRSEPRGYHTAVVNDAPAGMRYSFLLPGDRALPDPASRHQPEDVHGPSEIVSTEFDWNVSSWRTPDLHELVIYELHVGTFTPEGTFDAAIERLPDLRRLGVTALEIMPVAQFPGARNWGYDGVLAFAAQNSYGGPLGLKRLVDAAHQHDLNVILDVVYNHLGPEGNYLPQFGRYFTDTYHTPWGAAMNVDDAGSDEVRRYFIESALQWIDEFRIDGLRLDAIHAILDRSATPFLRELADAVHERAELRGRSALLIAESDLGDARVLRSERLGGLGMDAQWLDDFHHSLRTLLTGEDTGYYIDFGTLAHFARACRRGFVYTGEYSRYRDRRHGAPAPDILPRQFVVYAQNHDQVGNRMVGDRLAESVSPAQLRLAAAAVLLSPFTPMLFMGEEYGSKTPFPFFVDFGDEALIAAVREGRRAEFASFSWKGEPPDPQAVETFRSAVLDWDARGDEGHRDLLELHARLLELRRTEPGIHAADAINTDILDTNGGPSDGGGRDDVGVVSQLDEHRERRDVLEHVDVGVPFEEAELEPEKLEQRRVELEDYRTEVAATDVGIATLAGKLEGTERPDLQALAAALLEAERLLGEAVEHANVVDRRRDDLRRGHERFTALEKRDSELADRRTAAIKLDHLANGQLAGRVKVKLETFVLQSIFHEVLEEGNRHLRHMTGGRYTLLLREAAGATASGLELDVRDNAAGGATRPVATLSGGEGFLASLALALGLSEVAQRRSGGTELGALFIDEGFGSLDAHALDQVVGILRGLQDGHRMVGVISHVEELKRRIPARLHVVTGQAGSSVQMRLND